MLWYVAAGGAAGSVCRVLVGSALNGHGLPWGTAVANVVGSLVIGGVLGWTAALPADGQPWRALLAAGFCGGFTTFSSFSAEVIALVERGEPVRAALYAAGSVLACLAATFVGLLLARRLVAGP